MSKRNKLELTWVGKDKREKIEPRILIEDPSRSHHAARRVSETDLFDNRLIFGDNLLALKALEAEFTGKVKCVYIDPPYNTGSTGLLYDDGVEHSTWLTLIRERLEIIWKLLREDGSLWISIDDREMPYLRVVCDELFGRRCFIAQNIWQKRYSRDNTSAIGDVHEYVVVYARDPELFKLVRNRVPFDSKSQSVYKNKNNDPRGPWRAVPMTGAGFRKNMMYEIQSPSGRTHVPPEGRHWACVEEEYLKLLAAGRIYFGKNGDSAPSVIRYLAEVEGLTPWTWWPSDEVGHTDEAKKESHEIFGRENAFPTPKPERLVKRILDIATKSGDLVLDSFAGSGTTGAVAHKMGRRWIMVELGEHCHTHIIPRLKKVIDGEDPGGVTEAVGWKGGGGFRHFRLAPSLLEQDRWGNWVISKSYDAAMLAEAMCRHTGFTYAPSETLWWRHGHSTETDFIFVTTRTLTREYLAALSEEVGEGRTLLVCCAAFEGAADAHDNLTLKKIPATVLGSCEFGRDDYSLKIASLPQAEPEPVAEPAPAPKRRVKAKPAGGATLFDTTAEEP